MDGPSTGNNVLVGISGVGNDLGCKDGVFSCLVLVTEYSRLLMYDIQQFATE